MLVMGVELAVTYYYTGSSWLVRDAIIGAAATSGGLAIALFYMNLLYEHRSVKLLIAVGIFFSLDLILIWTASLVH
jgi:hypothetical protein